jgi:hypothetical protein
MGGVVDIMSDIVICNASMLVLVGRLDVVDNLIVLLLVNED